MTHSFLPPFDVTVTTGQTSVREVLSCLLDKLVPLDLDVEEAGTVELVVAEALNNIVEHAYPTPTDDGPIDIRCEHKADGLHLQITDEGAPMPDGQLPVGMAPSLDVEMEDMPEGEFGWFLIKDLARDVSYIRQGSRNQLALRLAVGVVR